MERADAQKRWSNVVFGVLFLISLLLFGRIMLPFVMPVLLGLFLTVLVQPVHDWLCRRTGERRALCAALSTVGVLLLIVVPVAVAVFFVGRELLGLADQLHALLDRPEFLHHAAAKLPSSLQRWVLPTVDAPKSSDAVMSAVASSAAVLKQVLDAGTGLAIDVFLMSVSMYYFFLDGRRLYAEIARLFPMDRRYFDAFAKEFKDVAYAIVYGNTLTAVVQGAIGFVGLLIAGVPHAPVWGVAMVGVAMIPLGGTALVWLPISLVLMVTGRVGAGLFLLAWGTFLVSTIDNLIRPKLAGARMTLHPLLVFLSMFGGLAVFGMMGLLVGPLIAAIFMAMVRIYRRDFMGAARGAIDRLASSSARPS